MCIAVGNDDKDPLPLCVSQASVGGYRDALPDSPLGTWKFALERSVILARDGSSLCTLRPQLRSLTPTVREKQGGI